MSGIFHLARWIVLAISNYSKSSQFNPRQSYFMAGISILADKHYVCESNVPSFSSEENYYSNHLNFVILKGQFFLDRSSYAIFLQF
jgi:hypothetical protein